MAKKVILQHSSGLTENTPSVPQAKDLNYGELAINYNATEPVLIIKDSSNQIVTFGSVKSNHNHDERYYKQDEIDSFLAGKSSTNHAHPQYSLTSHTHSQYSTTSHTHDDRYYTETEMDGFLAGKSATGHTHNASAITGGTIAYARISGLIGTSAETIAAGNHTHDMTPYSLTSHTHDNRYYTETEINGLLAGKAASGHTTVIAGTGATGSIGHVKADGTSIAVDTYGTISVVNNGHTHNQYSSTGHTHDDRYYTETEMDGFLAGKASTAHTGVIAATGTTGHIKIDGATVKLNSSNQLYVVNNAHTHNQYSPTGHTHPQYSSTGHNHDERYYTETEINGLLAGKAASGHTTEIASTGATGHIKIDGTTVKLNSNNQLYVVNNAHTHNQYSPTGHTHDDRYYTETEMDGFLAGKSPTGHSHDVATTAKTGFVKVDGTSISVDSNGKISVVNNGHTHNQYSQTGHTHDDRYYTETEINGLLAGKAASGHTIAVAGSGTTGSIGHVKADGTSIAVSTGGTISVINNGHTHNQYSPTGHNHDDRYYTETEMDGFLAGKAASGHTTVKAATGSTGTLGHVRADGTTIAVDSNAVISVIASGHSHPQYSQTGHNHDERYYTETEIDGKLAGKAASGHTSVVAGNGTAATVTLGHVKADGTSITANSSGVITVIDNGHTHNQYSPIGHTHDDRYYTETEMNGLLAGKSATGHTHSQYAASGHTSVVAGNGTTTAANLGHVRADGSSITANSIGVISVIASGHNHDDKYYTETEMDGFLAGKASTAHTSVIAATGTTGHIKIDGATVKLNSNNQLYVVNNAHTHNQYSSTGHNHDERYYTETEINGLLAERAASGHTSVIAGSGATGTLGHVRVDGSTIDVNATTGVISLKETYSLSTHNHDDRYYTETEMDGFLAGKASTAHTNVVASSTALGHIKIDNSSVKLDSNNKLYVVNNGHTHNQYSPTGHTHDDRYYTETEINGLLAEKAASGHTNTVAGTGTTGTLGHVRVDGTTIAIDASGVIGVKDVSKYSITSHTHDDRYYTETEVDTFLAGKASTAHTSVIAATGTTGHIKIDGTTVKLNSSNQLYVVNNGHTHNQYSSTGHTHDERYYTRTEVDGLIVSSVNYKGTTGATPSSGKVGDMYIASAQFTVASGSSASGAAVTVEQGDYIICRTAGKWDVIQKNITGATYKGSTWTDGQLVKVNGSNGEIVSCGYALSVVSSLPASPNANTIYILK